MTQRLALEFERFMNEVLDRIEQLEEDTTELMERVGDLEAQQDYGRLTVLEPTDNSGGSA